MFHKLSLRYSHGFKRVYSKLIPFLSLKLSILINSLSDFLSKVVFIISKKDCNNAISLVKSCHSLIDKLSTMSIKSNSIFFNKFQ